MSCNIVDFAIGICHIDRKSDGIRSVATHLIEIRYQLDGSRNHRSLILAILACTSCQKGQADQHQHTEKSLHF